MTAASTLRAPTPPLPEDRVVLHGISWDTYSALLHEIGDQNIRMTYDSGILEISLPVPEHEKFKKLIGGMIELLSLELDISISRFGSTTFRKKRFKKGTEPDECYYVQNEPKVRGIVKLDLKRHPPPDLVVEVDITSGTVEKQPIYAALGVPEVWRFDGRRVSSLHRTPAGEYVSRPKSLAFPFLRMADVDRFLRLVGTTDEMTIIRGWRDWVRQRPKL